ncbi:RsmE family RNA methyltransferase [Leptospira paudalimensis]|uniref:Ribosomal RNA small subunit methyltransferase E n=1 Tax=Leptospira paudalimensis TaxID=2950024 RepID=A0ABT3M733_9LEPT|nr:RsmE family RNA methyltransferase [Leptospira paudalimensis]MCW7504204.1 RsmE family RNA methyltransferase [Leptospira paudalimensis]
MNWILIQKGEIHFDESVTLTDDRHIHIRTILKKRPDDEVQVVIQNEGNFMFRVLQITETESILIKKESLSLILNPLPIHCFFSLPRPQTAKKILHLAGAYGINSLHFFATETKNKEYWTSPVYTKDWNQWVHTGMSQTGNVHFPMVQFGQKKNWKEFLETWEGNVIVLDRMGEFDLKTYKEPLDQRQNTLFVFGPESGWNENDMKYFDQLTFKTITLGNINLRTEFAFSSLLYLLFRN